VPITDVLPPVAEITVGGKKFPVVAPVHVGDQLTLLVRSRFPTEIEIKEFGLVGFATLDTPARFELLPDTPGTFGILFVPPHRVDGRLKEVAGRIEVLPQGGRKGEKKKAERKPGSAAKSRARAGSGRA
jgi:hypothetical protein